MLRRVDDDAGAADGLDGRAQTRQRLAILANTHAIRGGRPRIQEERDEATPVDAPIQLLHTLDVELVPASERLFADARPERTIPEAFSASAQVVLAEPSRPDEPELADRDEAGQLPEHEIHER